MSAVNICMSEKTGGNGGRDRQEAQRVKRQEMVLTEDGRRRGWRILGGGELRKVVFGAAGCLKCGLGIEACRLEAVKALRLHIRIEPGERSRFDSHVISDARLHMA